MRLSGILAATALLVLASCGDSAPKGEPAVLKYVPSSGVFAEYPRELIDLRAADVVFVVNQEASGFHPDRLALDGPDDRLRPLDEWMKARRGEAGQEVFSQKFVLLSYRTPPERLPDRFPWDKMIDEQCRYECFVTPFGVVMCRINCGQRLLPWLGDYEDIDWWVLPIQYPGDGHTDPPPDDWERWGPWPLPDENPGAPGDLPDGPGLPDGDGAGDLPDGPGVPDGPEGPDGSGDAPDGPGNAPDGPDGSGSGGSGSSGSGGSSGGSSGSPSGGAPSGGSMGGGCPAGP
ncbi:hypothetical protein ACFL6C_07440 [Myxococcota bacterium]